MGGELVTIADCVYCIIFKFAEYSLGRSTIRKHCVLQIQSSSPATMPPAPTYSLVPSQDSEASLEHPPHTSASSKNRSYWTGWENALTLAIIVLASFATGLALGFEIADIPSKTAELQAQNFMSESPNWTLKVDWEYSTSYSRRGDLTHWYSSSWGLVVSYDIQYYLHAKLATGRCRLGCHVSS